MWKWKHSKNSILAELEAYVRTGAAMPSPQGESTPETSRYLLDSVLLWQIPGSFLETRSFGRCAWAKRKSAFNNFNSLKPSGYFMYHQVILKTLQSAHNVFMCFIWFAEKGAIIFLRSFYWFLVIEKNLFYCAVRTESFNKIQVNLRLVSANERQVWCRLDYRPSGPKICVIFFSSIAVGTFDHR